ILTVSSVMPHKNVHTLIHAMRILHQRGHKDIRLIIAGEAPADRPYANDVRRLVREGGLDNAITLTGHLDRPAVAGLYASARVYVTLSMLEAFGLTLLEAMAHRVPIVCSRIPAFDEVCGNAGVRVDAQDAEAVAAAIEALWNNEARRRELSDLGEQRVAT